MEINWELLYLSCIGYFFCGETSKVYLLGIDEVVESKAGKSTHGVVNLKKNILARLPFFKNALQLGRLYIFTVLLLL
jgi:hypothetical protein